MTDEGAPPLDGHDEVSREDILAHPATLHEAGVLTEEEVLAKTAEVDSTPMG